MHTIKQVNEKDIIRFLVISGSFSGATNCIINTAAQKNNNNAPGIINKP